MKTNKVKKIGIYGGSFNPIHNGHLICAQWVYEQLKLDTILFLPSGIPPHKTTKVVLPGNLRKTMVQLAIQQQQHFQLESYEVDTNEKHYTYNTVKWLKEKYPNDELYFIIGGDMVEDLPNWYNVDELVKLVQFVGVNRVGSTLQSVYPILTVHSPLIEISSSLIRNRIAQGNSIRYLVPQEVCHYIKSNGLYRS